MRLNIIHLLHRKDRLNLLLKELESQNISDYLIWDGVTKYDNPTRNISEAHKSIVRHAKSQGYSEVLIAEDDIHFLYPNAFRYYLQFKPTDFDMYLGSVSSGKVSNDNIVNDFSGLTMYIIKDKFYDVFLQAETTNQIDRGLRGLGKFVVCNPFVAIQHNGYSDNYKRDCNYDIFFKRQSEESDGFNS